MARGKADPCLAALEIESRRLERVLELERQVSELLRRLLELDRELSRLSLEASRLAVKVEGVRA